MKKTKPLIGISGCLLGQAVRYNKGNTHDKWITNELSKYVDFYPICPEVEMGLGTPREEIHLYYTEQDKKEIKLRSKFTRKELTSLANETYEKMNKKSDEAQIDGYILMKKSPSCGLGNVKTVSEDEKGNVKLLPGLYANNLERRYPDIPKQDSGRMKNDLLREQFIQTVYAHYRFSQLDGSMKSLRDFQKKYKYILMEHSQNKMRQLGGMAANLENLLAVLRDYKAGLSGYMIPVNLISFFIKKNKVEYLMEQYYFDPYPKELKLSKVL